MRGNPALDVRHHDVLVDVVEQIVEMTVVQLEGLVFRTHQVVEVLATACSRSGGMLQSRFATMNHDGLVLHAIALLQLRAVFSRPITGAGSWGVRYSAFGEPSFCAVLQGTCRLAVDGHRPVTLQAGDFVLLPATPGFTMSSPDAARFERLDPNVMSKVAGEVRHGTRGGRPDVRLLGCWFVFGSPDAGLLVSLLPSLVGQAPGRYARAVVANRPFV
jgi:hypothetical protein